MDQEILRVFFYDVRCAFLCLEHSSQRWRRLIECEIDEDHMLFALPSCSPDTTPCDFFLWGYIKGQVYVPPLPTSILELKV
jgi:hypothetical protein